MQPHVQENSKQITHDEVASGLALFTAWVEAQMAYHDLPGLSVGVIHDQTLIWSRGFGYADVARKTPTTPTTLYRIASMTKLFTSTAIMQLRDAGLLQLDDPVKKHLPWFQIRNPYPDAPAITIRHLLTHASGLPREAAFPYWNTNEFPTIEEVRALLPTQELALPTASDWKYSNLGAVLAGEIVAAVARMPYTTYVTEQILRPLGMENTFVDAIPPDHPLLATGYGRRLPHAQRELSPYSDCRGLGPATNMTSNVEDLAQFVMLQFRSGPRQGKQVLTGSSVREMHQAQRLNNDWSRGSGLGFLLWRLNRFTLVGQNAALRGYRTDLQCAPADKVGVVVLTNADDGAPQLYIEKAFQWIVPALLKAGTPKPKVGEAAEAWQRYVGRYRTQWDDRQVLIYHGELVVIVPLDPDPLASMLKLKPLGPDVRAPQTSTSDSTEHVEGSVESSNEGTREHTFRIETRSPFSMNGEMAIFELDGAGKVTRLKLCSYYTYPIEEW